MFGNKTLAVLLFAILANVNGFPLEEKKMDGRRYDGRIVGGNATDIRLLPYQVSLMFGGEHFCGGSIIAPEWVVTAAHCMKSYLPVKYISVRIGSNYSTKGGEIHQIDRYINHHLFDQDASGSPVYDISLIHLTKPIEFDDTKKPIPLFENGDMAAVGSYGVISGWGIIASNNMSTTVELRAVLVPIVSREICAKAYEHLSPLPEDQICAGYPEGGKDSCLRDSGGPLAIGGRLAGIISWGVGCALPKKPGVYTEVAKYRNWIKEQSSV